MDERLKQWLAHIEAVRADIDSLVQLLKNYGATVEPEKTRIVGELPYIIEFRSLEPAAVTTVRIILKDHQTNSDVVITNMTTLPRDKRKLGLGSKAIQSILQWAADNHLNEVRATQISEGNESFWQRNGFEKCPPPNPCNDFIHVITTKEAPKKS
jgi:GNAT superfamily N-acetyltransferase